MEDDCSWFGFSLADQLASEVTVNIFKGRLEVQIRFLPSTLNAMFYLRVQQRALNSTMVGKEIIIKYYLHTWSEDSNRQIMLIYSVWSYIGSNISIYLSINSYTLQKVEHKNSVLTNQKSLLWYTSPNIA